VVPESGAQTAREVLLEAELISADRDVPRTPPIRLLAWLLIALAIGALIVWLVTLIR
jgi:hypothetical protein